MTATVASTAAVARQALQRDSFLVVILDVLIGDGSGFDLLEELRRTGSTVAARVAFVCGELVELTAKEFDLLAFLAARPGYVFSRNELLRAVWDSAAEWQQTATVTEHIHRSRAKVERDCEHPQLLRTVRGVGYRFDRPAETCDALTTETSPDIGPGSVVWTADRILSADSRAVELLGCRSDKDLIGRSPFELVAPRSVDAAVERLRLFGQAGTLHSQLLHFLRADGTEVAVEVDSSACEWQGQTARSVTISLAPDLSVQLRHLVTGIYTEVSDAVIVTDLHSHIRSWNPAAERLYGWAEHEVLGRQVLDVLPWAPGDVGLAEAGATLEATGRWHGEAQQITREGAVIRVQGSTTVARNDDGEPIAVVSVNRAFALLEEVSQAPTTHDDLDMRRGIGLNVVAEGVETVAQQQALVALGCSIVQGFLHGAPTPAAAVPLHRVTSGESQPGGLPARPTIATASEAVASALEALQRVRAGDQRDQASNERDQAADHRDESAEQRDKAADLCDAEGDHRYQAGDERDSASVRRDDAAARRDLAADQRDAVAGRRDKAGAQRDEIGDQRDRAGNRRDEAGASRYEAASDRDQAAAWRDRAAARLEGGVDQKPTAAAEHAALARRDAAVDRRNAAEDRRAAAGERVRAESDRETAQADRGVGARERAQAEADRDNARADRGAGASERTQAEADRATAGIDRWRAARGRGEAQLTVPDDVL